MSKKLEASIDLASVEGASPADSASLDWVPVDATKLVSVTRAFASGASIESVCEDMLTHFVGLLSADAGAIFLAEHDWVRAVASVGMPPRRVESLHGAAAWAIRDAKAIRMNTRGNSDRSLDPREHGDNLCVPVVLGPRVLGAFVLARGQHKAPFEPREVTLAAGLAGELAMAMDRMHVQVELGQERDRIESAQLQLEAYAKDFREIFLAEREKSAQLAGALAQLQSTYLATVRSLAVAVEAKDEYTGGHLARVSRYAMAILKEIAPQMVKEPEFHYGFLLHDVGKLSVPDSILCKRGPLDEDEWAVMRKHPEMGTRILGEIPFLTSASEVVRFHHERWDGKGYPDGLGGTDIPLGARIFAVADSYDAMTTDRPYRNALSRDAALRELRTHAGSQFWPDAVEAFMSIPPDELAHQ